MRELALAALCMFAELVFIGPRPGRPEREQVQTMLRHLREPYCAAFVRHCTRSVYPPPSPGRSTE